LRSRSLPCLALLAAWTFFACSGETIGGVKPAISVTLPDGAETLSFGKVPVGQRAKLELRVNSDRPVPLVVSQIVPTSKDGSAHLAFSAKPAAPFSVAGSSSSVVEVWFEPADVRHYQAELVIESDDPDRPRLTVPMAGEGIEGAIRVVGCLTSDADPTRCADTLVEAPTVLDMGEVVAGQHERVQVTIQNLGVDVLEVHSVGFADEAAAGAAGFAIDDKFRRAVAISRLSNQTFQVEFTPPLGAKGEVEARVAIASSDRRTPRVELPLRVEVVPNRPPLACVVVREIVSASGQVREPPPGPVIVEPTETVILDADARPGCTADPEDGKDVTLAFDLDGPDAYGRLDPVPGAPMRRSFRAEVIGSYTVTLEAADSLGAIGAEDENGVPAVAAFEVRPRQDIALEIKWAAENVDLDVHFVRGENGFDALWSDVDDCAILAACGPGEQPLWGLQPPVTSPRLAIDDQGGGSLVETVLLNGPEPSTSYWIFAHFYDDRRPERSSAPSCSADGPACEGGAVCAAGRCMPPVEASARIFSKGIELELGPAGTIELEQPCDTWVVAKVTWPPDSEGEIVVHPFEEVFASHDATGPTCPVFAP